MVIEKRVIGVKISTLFRLRDIKVHKRETDEDVILRLLDSFGSVVGDISLKPVDPVVSVLPPLVSEPLPIVLPEPSPGFDLDVVPSDPSIPDVIDSSDDSSVADDVDGVVPAVVPVAVAVPKEVKHESEPNPSDSKKEVIEPKETGGIF